MNIKAFVYELIMPFIALSPNSPNGRIGRIKVLQARLKCERDVAACIVYARDVKLGRWLSDDEITDAKRVGGRALKGEIKLPKD